MKTFLIVVLCCYVHQIVGQDANNVDSKPKNTNSIGYQIGGNTLIGYSYEFRTSSEFGVHIGGGLAGFGAGIRYHIDNDTHSPFWDLNYKDAGFGLFESIAIEFGGLWKIKENSGFRYTIGLQKPLYIKDSFKEKLFKGKKTPPVLLAAGLGWGW